MCAYSLSQAHLNKLSHIVSELSEFKSGDDSDIHIFLTMAGLSHFCGGLQLSKIPRARAFSVIKMLDGHGPLEDTPNCHALGALLRHVDSLGEISQNDKKFIATIIVEYCLLLDANEVNALCEAHGISFSPPDGTNTASQDSIADRLNKRRAERSTASTIAPKYDRIDHDRILRKFDLIDQVYKMQNAVTGAEIGSIVHVVTTSSPILLQKYMIPRLLDDLEESRGIILDFRQVSIAPSDLINDGKSTEIVERRLRAIYQDLSWQGLFEACASRNMWGCFLSIENHGMQSEQLKQFAMSVDAEAPLDLKSQLEAHGQRLAICWVNSNEHPLPPERAFHVPQVQSFADNDVSTWFHNELNRLNVTNEDLQNCKILLKQRLAYTRGEPVLTYQAMQDIITTLSR